MGTKVRLGGVRTYGHKDLSAAQVHASVETGKEWTHRPSRHAVMVLRNTGPTCGAGPSAIYKDDLLGSLRAGRRSRKRRSKGGAASNWVRVRVELG